METVEFLINRFKGPDMDNNKKLGLIIKYIRGGQETPLTLEADNAYIMKLWVDVLFVVHPDKKSTQ